MSVENLRKWGKMLKNDYLSPHSHFFSCFTVHYCYSCTSNRSDFSRSCIFVLALSILYPKYQIKLCKQTSENNLLQLYELRNVILNFDHK